MTSNQIICFYEAINPLGNLAGQIIPFSGKLVPDEYVTWARQQTAQLNPQGYTFYRASWAKLCEKETKNPFTSDDLDASVSVYTNDEGLFIENETGEIVCFYPKIVALEHMMTLYGEDVND